eukprot:comp22707_c0_seq1/m.35252 comp22707_c0_seq1/g.35252  ORF comp22707_c0_seq1/g.35252 comp22707_c0_seq1/m.35252 type:complete len:643 (-) comp22707_c0_seq1:190-2118(-)
MAEKRRKDGDDGHPSIKRVATVPQETKRSLVVAIEQELEKEENYTSGHEYFGNGLPICAMHTIHEISSKLLQRKHMLKGQYESIPSMTGRSNIVHCNRCGWCGDRGMGVGTIVESLACLADHPNSTHLLVLLRETIPHSRKTLASLDTKNNPQWAAAQRNIIKHMDNLIGWSRELVNGALAGRRGLGGWFLERLQDKTSGVDADIVAIVKGVSAVQLLKWYSLGDGDCMAFLNEKDTWKDPLQVVFEEMLSMHQDKWATTFALKCFAYASHTHLQIVWCKRDATHAQLIDYAPPHTDIQGPQPRVVLMYLEDHFEIVGGDNTWSNIPGVVDREEWADVDSEQEEKNEGEVEEPFDKCQICGREDSLEGNEIVVCDGCELGYHRQCCDIPSFVVETEYPWFCVECKNRGLSMFDFEKVSANANTSEERGSKHDSNKDTQSPNSTHQPQSNQESAHQSSSSSNVPPDPEPNTCPVKQPLKKVTLDKWRSLSVECLRAKGSKINDVKVAVALEVVDVSDAKRIQGDESTYQVQINVVPMPGHHLTTAGSFTLSEGRVVSALATEKVEVGGSNQPPRIACGLVSLCPRDMPHWNWAGSVDARVEKADEGHWTVTLQVKARDDMEPSKLPESIPMVCDSHEDMMLVC